MKKTEQDGRWRSDLIKSKFLQVVLKFPWNMWLQKENSMYRFYMWFEVETPFEILKLLMLEVTIKYFILGKIYEKSLAA